MDQTPYTARQIEDARMDLTIAVEHYVDASINVQQERYDEAQEKYASSERRRDHAARVLGTTMDEFDTLFHTALHARITAYPVVSTMFHHHADNEVDSCDACRRNRVMQYQYHPSHDAIVTAGDIRADRNAYNAEAATDKHDADCDCDECTLDAESLAIVYGNDAPAWNARLAARAASIVTAAGGLALSLVCLTGTPASAHELTAQFHDHTYLWPEIGTIAYSAGCDIVQFWEDGSAVASCPEDNGRYVFDPDGNSVAAPGHPVRDAGWYVLPEARVVSS